MQLFVQTVWDGISTGGVIALVAVGLSLVFRISRFINVAHVDLATVAAYVTLLATGSVALAFPLAAVVGVIVVMGVGLLTYLLVYRRLAGELSITLIIASIGVAFFLRYLVTFIWGSNQLAFDLPVLRSIRVAGLRMAPIDIAIVAIALIVFVGLAIILRYSAFGRALRAVADNPELARVSGVAVDRVVTRMWLVGSALAAVGGIALAAKTVITPYLGWHLLLPAFAAMILGGIGSVGGTLLGALVIGVVGELAAMYWLPTYRLTATFGVLVLVLMLRPQGLLGKREVAR